VILREWAARWGVPFAAIAELEAQLMASGAAAVVTPDPSSTKPGSEARQASLMRLDAAKHGVFLTRNNVGALRDERGVPVRYGLCNESKQQNKQVKSADYIGIKPKLITPSHVGLIIGQFTSREVKHEGWVYSGDEHEQAQLAWINFVISRGGDAAFCTGPGSFDN